MKGYIADLLLWLGHATQDKPQLYLHKSKDIMYGSSVQLSPEDNTYSQLDKDGITRAQMVVGALLWLGRAVNKTLLVALSVIYPQHTAAIEDTMVALY